MKDDKGKPAAKGQGPFSFFRLFSSLILHPSSFRMNLAVACGVAAGTAVLTGALLVGDSMRWSLRRLTLDRLGPIEDVLVADRFFRVKLADELADSPGFRQHAAAVVPIILLRASLENADPQEQSPARANQVNLIGSDERFWQLAAGPPAAQPGRREIVLNQPLADQLGARVGDAVLLRLPKPAAIPAESALGERRETVTSQRLTVCAIIPAKGLGRFALRSTQQQPRNAYVPLDALQTRLAQPRRANVLLVTGNHPQADLKPEDHAALQRMLQPTPADYGLSIERTPRGYVNITSDRMILPPAVQQAIGDGKNVQPVLVYLANTIAANGHEIPYSTVAAMDFTAAPPLGPFLSREGKPLAPLADDQLVLNSWAAAQLAAKPGDRVTLRYFEPESTAGKTREDSITLRLAAVAELSGAADDRALVPSLPGVTDRLNMADWDPPFPFDARRIRHQDEEYWNEHGAVPKAFVSLATGRRLWSSRFGQTTSIRIVEPSAGHVAGAPLLKIDPAAMGFVFQPLKQQGLAAAAGTTPFSVFFLAFSFFIILAAVMLVALLFRLAIERRAAEIGILLAVGFSRRRVARLLAAEGLAVAAGGGLLGIAAGVGYAALLLAGLQSWWLAAITTPFLHLHMTLESLLIGYASGLLIAMLTIHYSVRRIARIDPRQLLAGDCIKGSEVFSVAFTRIRRLRVIELALLLLAIAPAPLLVMAPIRQDVQAGAFFAAGALSLGALLLLIALHLRRGATGPAVAVGRGNLFRLALRNAARNPSRSTLTTGLVAAACFLIVAVSAFRVDPSQQAPALASGNGGFALVGQSDQPIYQDLGSHEGRTQLGFSPEEDHMLAQCTIIPLRVKAGDDASCLNLYRPRQPRVLGVPSALVAHDGFAWADAPKDSLNPWQLLAGDSTYPAHSVCRPHRHTECAGYIPATVAALTAPSISHASGKQSATPVILEQNTANYALNLWQGLGEPYDITDARDRPLHLRVAALLADSIFQGDLLVDEKSLLAIDPELSGYRFFLIETPPAQTQQVQRLLERVLGDYGFATETTAQRMAGFLAVQNTYLSTFQSLGALGLLLGTIGLAAVQLRNVLERRGELALLRAAGFRRAALAQLVVLENLLLLLTGLAVGALAALVAVLPHLLGRAAAIPWASLAGTLTLVLLAGVAASLIAVASLARTPLLAALREGK